MYTQIVGKLRLALCAPENQFWHVPFYLTVRGLTTSPMPYGERTLELDFDFIDHALVARDSRRAHARAAAGAAQRRRRSGRRCARCSASSTWRCASGITPSRSPIRSRSRADTQHCSYDADAARTFFEVLRRVDMVFKQYRGRFSGKSSPVHFFWGSFDLAVTRFSGRPAPPRARRRPHHAAVVQRRGHERRLLARRRRRRRVVLRLRRARAARLRRRARRAGGGVLPRGLKELLLPYEAVRTAPRPADEILAFADSATQRPRASAAGTAAPSSAPPRCRR